MNVVFIDRVWKIHIIVNFVKYICTQLNRNYSVDRHSMPCGNVAWWQPQIDDSADMRIPNAISIVIHIAMIQNQEAFCKVTNKMRETIGSQRMLCCFVYSWMHFVQFRLKRPMGDALMIFHISQLLRASILRVLTDHAPFGFGWITPLSRSKIVEVNYFDRIYWSRKLQIERHQQLMLLSFQVFLHSEMGINE